MKDSHVALLGMAAGFGIQTMFSQVLTGLADHQATLQTVGNLVLAWACLRHGWPSK